MALCDRKEHDEGSIHNLDFLMKTCFQCKFWNHFVKKEYSYCHRCVNNLRIPIRKGRGYRADGLYDYYMPSESVQRKSRMKV